MHPEIPAYSRADKDKRDEERGFFDSDRQRTERSQSEGPTDRWSLKIEHSYAEPK